MNFAILPVVTMHELRMRVQCRPVALSSDGFGQDLFNLFVDFLQVRQVPFH